MAEIDLIERLRRGRLAYQSKSGPVYAGPTAIETEAADELSRLRGREEEYRKALGPFAEAVKAFDAAAEHFGAPRQPDSYRPSTYFTFGDLRAAARALAPTKQKGDQDGGKHGGGL